MTDMLRWLYKTDKTNRDDVQHWRGWSREKFVEHLRLLYPQLSNAADKSYLDMIKEILFQYDLDNPVLELKFQSELSKIVKHYDSLTFSEEAEAVKILLGKINIPNVFNWIPIFNEMATVCDLSLPINKVDDFRFVLTGCFEDARRSRARTISYRWNVVGTPETHYGDIKAVSFKEKTHGNSSKSGNKTPRLSLFQRLTLFYANSVVRTITLTPIVIRELQSSLTIKTVLMSVRRPMVG